MIPVSSVDGSSAAKNAQVLINTVTIDIQIDVENISNEVGSVKNVLS